MDYPNASNNNNPIIIEDVPYTISDDGNTKNQSPIINKQNAASDSSQSSSTYSFSSPNGYGFIRTIQFTSTPITGSSLKGLGESLSSLGSLLLPIMLLSMLKLISGTDSMLEDPLKHQPSSTNKQIE